MALEASGLFSFLFFCFLFFYCFVLPLLFIGEQQVIMRESGQFSRGFIASMGAVSIFEPQKLEDRTINGAEDSYRLYLWVELNF